MSRGIVIGTNPGTGLRADLCPFPGIASYDLDQRNSFKGRDQETIELARVILGQRLTVLTAGSGDGKTSLIHAGLTPMLLREGIEVAVAEPGGQSPVWEIGSRLLARMMPLASDNLPALRWLFERGMGSSLRSARKKLVAARSGAVHADVPPEIWPAQRPIDLLKEGPLRTWLTNEDFPDAPVDTAMSAVAAVMRSRRLKWPGVDGSIRSAIQFFENISPDHELARLNSHDSPEQLKDAILQRLAHAFKLRSKFSHSEVVLVVDQFEEIFVQFRGGRSSRSESGAKSDPFVTGSAAEARWRHRKATFALLAGILERSKWPVRMVLSLRKEHYAELDAALLQTGLGKTYHLAPLHKSQALTSLKQLAPMGRGRRPPSKTAISRWDDFVRRAVELLASDNEGQWVDATQLSSLGRWLWLNELPDDVEGAVKQALVREMESILSIKGEGQDPPLAAGRAAAVPRRDDHVATTHVEQQEAIDILGQLRIPGAGGGRRLSMPISALEAPPWRSRPLRQEMIRRLRRARLIRQDRRNEQDYLEIVHERMIDVIEELRQRWKNQLYVDLDQILEHLRAVLALDPFRRVRLLPEQFATLDANRQRLDLSDFAASRIIEAMLATPELWVTDESGLCPGAGFLQWLAEQVEAQGRAIELCGADEAEPIKRRALASWQAGELASPALAEAARHYDIGLEGSERTSWLLLSNLFHGREGEQRLREMATEFVEGRGR